MLSDCVALDLTDEKGFLCGKILADLGVQVIKIEKPGGGPARNIGPFWSDIPEAEKSLYWFAYNSNKKGITLNIETADGQEIFKRLAGSADFVIESFPSGHLKKLGIDYACLSKVNKKIIWASITPFGTQGPYSGYKDSDIVVMGMSGTLYQTGETDGPPVHISQPQACLHAGADAAVGSMIAYYHREKTGEGQHVDVSMQQSAAWFQANAIPTWELSRGLLKRAGAFRAGPGMSKDIAQRQVWPCRDGFVFFNVIGGQQGARTLSSLTSWMDSEGMATEFCGTKDWSNFDMFTVTREEMETISQPIGKFFLKHTRKELLEGAVPRQVSIGPLFGMQGLFEDEDLKTRNFWVDINHPELGTSLKYPREFVKSSESSYAIRFRAPLIGEHNEQIYSRIGLKKQDQVVLGQAGVI